MKHFTTSFLFRISFFFLLIIGSVQGTQAATFSLSPGSQQFTQECVSSVNILLDTEGASTNAVDMFLNFNSSEVEFIDQNPNIAGIQIKQGTVFPAYATLDVNEGTGRIQSTAFDVFGSFNGNGVYATLVFRSKPGVNATTFTFDYTNGSSTDSNVADVNTSNDLLSGVTNGSYTFQSGFCNPDNQAPQVTTISPSNGTQDVPLDSNVSFTITDNQSGVDIDTVEIQVHTSNYDANSAEVSFSGDPLDYDFVINPAADFPFNTGITVVIQAEDLDGNRMSPRVINFNAPDTSAPFVTNVNPANGASGVALNSNVSLRVRDNDLGVDLPTVKITVDEVDYFSTSGQVTVTGDAQNYLFTINPSEDFPALTEIAIVVEATDLGGNEMTPQTYRFNRPPAPAVCGDGVVEGDEQCEPAGTVVCDDQCQIVVQACLPSGGGGGGGGGGYSSAPVVETVEVPGETVFSQVTETRFIERVTEVFQDYGITDAPEQVSGIPVQTVSVDPFLCSDQRSESTDVSTNSIPYTPPEGYEVIKKNIQFNCDGSLDTTLTLPQEYVDVQAVKCIGGECVSHEITSTTTIQCGADTTIEIAKTESQLAELEFGVLARQYDPSRYSISSVDEEAAEYRFQQYDGSTEKLVHASLKILSAPITIERIDGGDLGDSEKVQVELPYENNGQVASESIQVFVYSPSQKNWKVLPKRELLTDPSRVRAEFDLLQYMNGDSQVALAVMGSICDDCQKTVFEKVYQPEEPSRAAVVLVHDLIGSTQDWEAFLQDVTLSGQPWQAWRYGYQANQSLTATAKDLATALQIYNEEYDVVYVAAHGIGGLIAQEALSYAQRENAVNPNRFTFLRKVEKVILIGTPSNLSESSPLVLTYYDYLVNTGQGVLFGYDRLQELLKERPHIPQVPGIEYFVVAGTKPPEDGFSLESVSLMEQIGKNDGFVSTSSAQRVGSQVLNQQCVNYWEVAASHGDLISDPSARKVLGQVVSQDLSQTIKNTALLGYQNYFSLKDDSCSAEDSYILIGKKVKRQKTPDTLNCSCGNGYCGIDEDKTSCPSDCASIVREENYPWLFLLIVLLVLAAGTSAVYYTYKKRKNGKDKKKR